MADEMGPAPSPSVDLWRPDGPAARAAAAIMANAVASFNEALVPVLRGVRREARALCKRRPSTFWTPTRSPIGVSTTTSR